MFCNTQQASDIHPKHIASQYRDFWKKIHSILFVPWEVQNWYFCRAIWIQAIPFSHLIAYFCFCTMLTTNLTMTYVTWVRFKGSFMHENDRSFLLSICRQSSSPMSGNRGNKVCKSSFHKYSILLMLFLDFSYYFSSWVNTYSGISKNKNKKNNNQKTRSCKTAHLCEIFSMLICYAIV